MPYSLKGRNVLITGGSRGLGAAVAERFAAEGSNVAINYVSSEDRATALAAQLEENHKINAITLQGDVSSRSDCENLVKQTIEQLGGLDVIISNAGWTRISNFADLDALTDDEWDRCWTTNVKANLHLFRAAKPTLDANPDGGAFIITSSTAGITPGGSSMAYSVSKAAGLHLMKALASTQGSKIRVNALLPGLILTEWGQRFPKEVVGMYEEKVPLKRVPSVDDCADVFITIAKNTSMTGQQIQVDSGFVIR
ncbi:short chain dehydrogenase [Coccidioides immitis RS]|uniref:Short chain dehydrogenase n=5 Tax=Coccidioides TaxID=5500 RepID=J3KCP5_COCIM|nr:short chain dehydrogenase [Coccidioides immitis RS]XP_003068314.1 ketoreductase, putative [Coccidioides posadasii C735 delta SOWgp]EFW20039.1 short chain dehydrogenase/reductase [Coccidioides posadasii str. Silveira]KMM73391.1 short chain dehydrogenase/reductase family protein [Coccidioides posadasii RMSCC 3488]KMU88642.1 short chain dehydrogenase/reductase family protein [Coccidioides immitis H538.4]TPX19966.1 hypothetical protein DIZ76_017761 [Coccidioides immitis]EAS33033.3 short chain |eukprot:XP_003068314.1 ketoreductase, putative [Coccidioides posadasii C735 delta SOWgp]